MHAKSNTQNKPLAAREALIALARLLACHAAREVVKGAEAGSKFNRDTHRKARE